MLRKNAITISMFSNSTMLVGWCRPRRRLRRRRGSTIRLGNKRRGFSLGSRQVVQWGVMAGPLRMLRKIISEMVPNAQLIEALYWTLPFLRPQIFPLCWWQFSLGGASSFFLICVIMGLSRPHKCKIVDCFVVISLQFQSNIESCKMDNPIFSV